MKKIIDKVFEFKKLLSSIVVIIAILGGWWYSFDSRYVHAGEHKKDHEEMQQTISNIQLTQETNMQFINAVIQEYKKESLQKRVWDLEDHYKCEGTECREMMESPTWREYREKKDKLR